MTRHLSPAERARLEGVGYTVQQNVLGDDVARPSYRHDFNCAFLELALLDLAGEEALRAWDALGRLGQWRSADQLRSAAVWGVLGGADALRSRRDTIAAQGSDHGDP